MSQSWGHAARRLSPDQIVKLNTWSRVCRSGRHCQGATTHILSYHYVTGRQGRTSWADKYACIDHAERFAAKHGIAIADPAEQSQHALDRIIDAGLAR